MNSPEDERISEACALEDPQVIEALRQYREAMEAGQPLDRHAVFRRFPRIGEELRDCLDAIDVMHGVAASFRDEDCDASNSAALRAPPDSPRRVGDFRLIRMIGHGGMGVVYEAEQESLQRRVALKILPASVVLDPKNLRRFKIESQAAASLDHPNIVSIYSVGCENGVHYYAMQCVHGETLDQIIRRLREESHARQNKERPGRNGRPPVAELAAGENLGSPKAAKPHGAGMLEATTRIAERGGLGRPVDRSPADFVLDDSAGPTCAWETPPGGPQAIQTAAGDGAAAAGDALVSFEFPISIRDPEYFRAAARLGIQAADGLQHAHEMGVVHRDIKPGNLILDVRGCLRITDFGLARTAQSADTTLSGGVVGTLRYMSPEQLSGSRHVLDHRTDIYSLGVTLYELLTLEPAFDSDSRQNLMRQIAEEEPRPPCRVNRSIPRDLETIVLKSMAKEATGRYASAKDLADDLRRFLEHKPILARPASLGDRLMKWSRRHLWIIWTLIGVLVMGLVGTSVSSLIIWRARQETEAARAKAQANFDGALSVVDRQFSWVAQERLRDIPEAEQIRLEMIEEAAQFYDFFYRRNSHDANLQLQTGRAHVRKAELYRLSDYQQLAEASYQRAITLLEGVASQVYPNGRSYSFPSLGYAYAGLGASFHSSGRLSRAAEAYRQAIGVFEDPPPTTKGVLVLPGLPIAAIEARTELANVLTDLGQFDKAEQYYRSDIALHQTFLATRYKGVCYTAEQLTLARCCDSLGNLLYRTRRFRESAESYRTAVGVRRELPKEVAGERKQVEELTWSLNNLGAALWSAGDLVKAEESLENAIGLAEGLISRFPMVPGYQDQYAVVKGNLAVVRKDSRQGGEAEYANRLAIKILDDLADKFPRVPAYRRHLGALSSNLGALLASQSRFSEAESVLRQAIATQRLLALVYEDVPETSAGLLRSLGNLSIVLDSTGRHEEAEAIRRECTKILLERPAGFSAAELPAQSSPGEANGPHVAQAIDTAVVSSCSPRWIGWLQLLSGVHKEIDNVLLDSKETQKAQAVECSRIAAMIAICPAPSERELLGAADGARAAVSVDRENPESWTTLGLIEYRLGNDASAAESLKNSVALDGSRAVPMFLLAMVHSRMGHTRQARTWYELAVDLWKNDPAGVGQFAGVCEEAAEMFKSQDDVRDTGESLEKNQRTTK